MHETKSFVQAQDFIRKSFDWTLGNRQIGAQQNCYRMSYEICRKDESWLRETNATRNWEAGTFYSFFRPPTNSMSHASSLRGENKMSPEARISVIDFAVHMTDLPQSSTILNSACLRSQVETIPSYFSPSLHCQQVMSGKCNSDTQQRFETYQHANTRT